MPGDVVIHLQQPRRLVLELPLEAAALTAARRRFYEFLAQEGELDEIVVSDIVLCLQEACENAVKFSGSGGITVTLLHGRRTVDAVVRDHGIGLDPGELERLPDPMAESGRGLFLMNALMDDVEIRVKDGTEVRMRKTVHGRFPRPPRRPRPPGRGQKHLSLFTLQRRRRAA